MNSIIGANSGLSHGLFSVFVALPISTTTTANVIERYSKNVFVKAAAQVVQVAPFSILFFYSSLTPVALCFPILAPLLTNVAKKYGFTCTADGIESVAKVQLFSAKLFNLGLSFLSASIVLTNPTVSLAIPALIGVIGLIVNGILMGEACYHTLSNLRNNPA